MTLTHIDCVQGTTEWEQLRLGRLTASRACAAFKRNAPKKDGTLGPYSAKRRNLATALALERVTQTKSYDKPYQTDAMSRGTELEPQARDAYMARTGIWLRETGFWQHPTLMLGASFDGLSEDGTRGIEAKVLYPSNHLDIALAVDEGLGWDAIPEEYQWQIVHELAYMPTLVQMDFVCFCPEFPEESALVVVPVMRDEAKLADYRDDVDVFLAEVDVVEAKIRRLRKNVA